ncbi:MAG: hypothetical protein SNJ52_01795 [Verrucomicrobiia bacterium]
MSSRSMMPDSDLAALSRQVEEAMPKAGLFAGKTWRVSPMPFPLRPSVVEALRHYGYHLWRFQRAADLLYRRSVNGTAPEWVAGLLDLGKPPEVIDLGRSRAVAPDLPHILRPDFLLGEGGQLHMTELDSLPGGIGLTAWLNETYQGLGWKPIGADGMVEGFAKVLSGGDIFVSDESADYRPEMEWLAQRLGQREGREVAVHNQNGPARETGRLYRFFELFDLAALPTGGAMRNAAQHGRLQMTPPPKAFLEEKLWLALLWLKPLQAYWIRELGRRHFERLREVIPRAWIMDPTPLPYHAEFGGLGLASLGELAELSQRERMFALKISGFSPLAWGSRGVVIGHDTPQDEWAAAISHAIASFPNNPWILQRFVSGQIVEHPVWDPQSGTVGRVKARVRLCPYFFSWEDNVQLGGVLATLVPIDKKLIHGMSDAILVPCMEAED